MSLASQLETAILPPQIATKPAVSTRRVLISVNRKAGWRSRRQHAENLASVLEHGGYTVGLVSDLDELSELAVEQSRKGDLRAVIAVGGDGTALVVRNHVPLSIPVLPVPMGTENLLGRFVGQSCDPFSVHETLDHGVVIGLDLGRANGKHFLLMISAGFDAEVVRALHLNRRGNITRAAYLLPTLNVMRRYAYPAMRVSTSDLSGVEHVVSECRWMFAFNLPLYALGLPIAPDAIATDGLLDVCTFQRGSAWSVLRYLWHVRRGCHLGLADAALNRHRSFRLEGPNGLDIAYQLDGDFGGTLPVDVSVLPGELRLLVPRLTATRLGFEVRT
jgi:diacylglycerol kinase family enzyme